MPTPPVVRVADDFVERLLRATPRAWVTIALVAANVGVWLANLASGMSPMMPRPIELLAWGGSVALVRLENSSVAFDLSTGKELWRCSLVARAAATSDTVVTLKPAAKSLVNLEARDLRNGKVLWKKTSQFAATAVLARETSFYLLGDNLR